MRFSWSLGSIATLGALAGASHAVVPEDRTAVVAVPSGSAVMRSFGITELLPDDLPAMRVLHVRLSLANMADGEPWLFDVRDARLEIDSIAVGPLFANTDRLGLPALMIAPRTWRTVDLYYTLPATVQRDDDLPVFTVSWGARAANRLVGARVELRGCDGEREREDERRAGWGATWWAEPRYPWPQFHRGDGPIVHRPPTRFAIGTPPRCEPLPVEPDPCEQW